MEASTNITIMLSELGFEQWLAQPDDFLKFCTGAELQQIKDFIFDQLEDKDGAPEADLQCVELLAIVADKQAGCFRLHFEINRRFCCSDVESSRRDYIDFQFTYAAGVLQASARYFNWNVL